MTTPWISIFFYLLASVLGAFGQYLFKSGADQSGQTPLSVFMNGRVLTGVILFFAVVVLQLAAFKRGGSLMVLYPVYASTFIWVALIAHSVYGTRISPVNLLGMFLLVGGMYCMGHRDTTPQNVTLHSRQVPVMQFDPRD